MRNYWLLLLLIAATGVVQRSKACCECKCWQVNEAIIRQRSWSGCTNAAPITFTGMPTTFVERVNCDGVCPTGRALGYFPQASATTWSDAWVDRDALTTSFACGMHDARCTKWSPNHCAPIDKSPAQQAAAMAATMTSEEAKSAASVTCPGGSRRQTCKWTNRPCTLRCLQQETSVCNDQHHWCNYLKHGQVFCATTDCNNGFIGGSAPGIQSQATILSGDLEDF